MSAGKTAAGSAINPRPAMRRQKEINKLMMAFPSFIMAIY
jgi:hypothetical protein